MGKKKAAAGVWLLRAALILIAAATAALACAYFGRVDYTELAERAVANNLAADTYRFSSRSVLHIGTQQRCFADLRGEKAGAADRHIAGTLVGTEMEIYFVDGVLYRRDQLAGKWISVRLGELENAVAVMAELEPALNFAFESMGEAQPLPAEKADGRQCRCLLLRPVLRDEWIKLYFGDIEYKLWIAGRREPQIVKAEISGRSLENAEAVLKIELHFSDYNEDVILLPPQ